MKLIYLEHPDLVDMEVPSVFCCENCYTNDDTWRRLLEHLCDVDLGNEPAFSECDRVIEPSDESYCDVCEYRKEHEE
tara:strand:+ start:700 stop:930 length:231 start_codon:yes stop_codon:yes gene_type:complete